MYRILAAFDADNPYNIISFQTERYTDSARPEVNPAPDTLIRVFMAWKPSESYVDMEEQLLTAPERRLRIMEQCAR